MIFDKLFKNPKNYTEKKPEKTDNVSSAVSAPSVQYVHTSGNREKSTAKDNNVIVLWWINKKKKGYNKTSNKFPKWFSNQYGIDFNQVMDQYLQKEFLSDEGNIVKVTPAGEKELQKLDYVIYIHEHPQYCLSIRDFKKAPNLHKVPNADIVWGIFIYAFHRDRSRYRNCLILFFALIMSAEVLLLPAGSRIFAIVLVIMFFTLLLMPVFPKVKN